MERFSEEPFMRIWCCGCGDLREVQLVRPIYKSTSVDAVTVISADPVLEDAMKLCVNIFRGYGCISLCNDQLNFDRFLEKNANFAHFLLSAALSVPRAGGHIGHASMGRYVLDSFGILMMIPQGDLVVALFYGRSSRDWTQSWDSSFDLSSNPLDSALTSNGRYASQIQPWNKDEGDSVPVAMGDFFL